MSSRLVFALVALAACASEPAPKTPPLRATRTIRTARAEVRSRPTIEEVVGTVRAVRSATISPTVTGGVAEVTVTVGRTVRAGEILVRLSARDIDARVDEATAVAALAKLDRDRAARLQAEAAISVAQYDAALAQYQVAEAARVEASTLAQHAVLRAPFTGVVTAKLVNVGDTALPGQALIVLEAPDALRFEARVPEAAARGLVAGRPQALRLEGVDHEIVGTIGEIDPAVDATTRTVLVKLALPHDPELRSGRFGRLLIASGATDVDRDSRGLRSYGAASSRSSSSSKAPPRGCAWSGPRASATDRIEVVSGLAGGEQVAVSDAAELVDGQPVEVRR